MKYGKLVAAGNKKVAKIVTQVPNSISKSMIKSVQAMAILSIRIKCENVLRKYF